MYSLGLTTAVDATWTTLARSKSTATIRAYGWHPQRLRAASGPPTLGDRVSLSVDSLNELTCERFVADDLDVVDADALERSEQ